MLGILKRKGDFLLSWVGVCVSPTGSMGLLDLRLGALCLAHWLCPLLLVPVKLFLLKEARVGPAETASPPGLAGQPSRKEWQVRVGSQGEDWAGRSGACPGAAGEFPGRKEGEEAARGCQRQESQREPWRRAWRRGVPGSSPQGVPERAQTSVVLGSESASTSDCSFSGCRGLCAPSVGPLLRMEEGRSVNALSAVPGETYGTKAWQRDQGPWRCGPAPVGGRCPRHRLLPSRFCCLDPTLTLTLSPPSCWTRVG